MSGWYRLVLLTLTVALLSACSTPAENTPVAAVQPSVETSSPIPTEVPATPTLKATATTPPPSATATATPPPPTATRRATRTPAPTRTATTEPTATAVPTEAPTATAEPTQPPPLPPSPTTAAPPTVAPTATPTEHPLGLVARLPEIPELDAAVPNINPTDLENSMRDLFVGRGYAITRDERRGTALVLQFEKGASIYAVRVTPYEDNSGGNVEIRLTNVDSAFPTTTQAEDEGTPASAFGLALGDCVSPNGQSLQKVACDTPHMGEVVGVLQIPGAAGDPYPSDEVLYNVFVNDCETAFAEYTGAYPLGAHDYWYTGFGPTPSSWANGDRQAICLLFHVENELLTHSARDEFK